MKLTRDKIQRMMGERRGSTTSSTGSGGGGIIGNGVTPEYYNQNFELLYKQTVTSGGTTTTTYLTALPNEVVAVGTVTDETTGDVTVTALIGPVAKNALVIGNGMLVWDTTNNAFKVVNRDGVTPASFYATGSVSALGYAAGGGGGGASALTDLVDVTISSPTNGQVLMYNSSTGQWYNGTVQQGSSAWSDITGKPTTIGGYGITDAYIYNGTITLGNNSITPLTSYTETDPTVPAWAKAENKPSYSFSELTSHPTTISGYGITDAKIQNGTITLGSNTITPLTSEQFTGTVKSVGASDGLVTNQTAGAAITGSGVISINSETRQAISHGETAYGWGNHANAGYVTASALTAILNENPAGDYTSAPDGYILSYNNGYEQSQQNPLSIIGGNQCTIIQCIPHDPNWGSQLALGFGDSYLAWRNRINQNTTPSWSEWQKIKAGAADQLTTARSIWGQSFNGTADITGAMSNVTSINSLLYFDTTNNRIGVKASSPTQELDVNGSAIVTNLFIRSGLRLYEGSTYVWEIGYEAGSNNGCFNFYRYNSNTYAGNTWMAINPSNGNVGLGGTTNPQATIDIPSGGKIKIGGGVLKWDSTNNALYVEKSDGTSASFYATGSVSALGFSAGTSAVDAMTFGYLTVNNRLTFNGPSGAYTHTIYDNSEGGLNINAYNILNIGSNVMMSNKRLYLSSSSYIYVSGSTLYFSNGTTTRTIATL